MRCMGHERLRQYLEATANSWQDWKCVGCGTASSFKSSGQKKFCAQCSRLRATQRKARYRASMTEEEKQRELKKLRLRSGCRPREVVIAEKRRRADGLLPEIQRLKASGLSYRELAPQLGLTGNAVLGIVHRAKLRNVDR